MDRHRDCGVRRTRQADRQNRIRSYQDRGQAQFARAARDREDGLSLGRDGYTVRQAVEDWLAYGLARQGTATVEKYRIFCGKHVIPFLGAQKLRDLTAARLMRG